MKKDKLVDLFLELVKIPSPSGREREVAMFIKKYLEKKGMVVSFDNTGKVNGSNAQGNLIVKIKGSTDLPTVLFVAHMDTVETGEKVIKPVLQGSVIKSDGTTILGADDKAAVAALLQVLDEIESWKKRPTVLVSFTTREEQGMMGSSLLRLSENIDYCFNIDGPTPLGQFVYQTLGELPFTIKFLGKAVHAAVEPEKGINALKAAAVFISKLKLGKDKRGSIVNIGTIQGGKKNNIVPDEVVLSGQLRAFSQKDMDRIRLKIENEAEKVCKALGCTYLFETFPKEGAPPAVLLKTHPITRVAKRACDVLNLSFKLCKGPYTSDSNFLVQKYPTLTVGRGSLGPHSFEELISTESLHGLKQMMIELLKQMI